MVKPRDSRLDEDVSGVVATPHANLRDTRTVNQTRSWGAALCRHTTSPLNLNLDPGSWWLWSVMRCRGHVPEQPSHDRVKHHDPRAEIAANTLKHRNIASYWGSMVSTGYWAGKTDMEAWGRATPSPNNMSALMDGSWHSSAFTYFQDSGQPPQWQHQPGRTEAFGNSTDWFGNYTWVQKPERQIQEPDRLMQKRIQKQDALVPNRTGPWTLLGFGHTSAGPWTSLGLGHGVSHRTTPR